MDTTEDEVADAAAAAVVVVDMEEVGEALPTHEVVGVVEDTEEVGEDLPTHEVVGVPLHLFEVVTVAAEDFVAVRLGDALEEGMCFPRLTGVPLNPLL